MSLKPRKGGTQSGSTTNRNKRSMGLRLWAWVAESKTKTRCVVGKYFVPGVPLRGKRYGPDSHFLTTLLATSGLVGAEDDAHTT